MAHPSWVDTKMKMEMKYLKGHIYFSGWNQNQKIVELVVHKTNPIKNIFKATLLNYR